MRFYTFIAVLGAGALSIALAQETAEINWVLFPEAVHTAKRTYDKTVTAAKEQYEKAVAEARKPLVEALATAQRQATQVDNLDLAIALRNAKDSLETPDVTAAPRETARLLIGKWKVSVKNHFTDRQFVFDNRGGVRMYNADGRFMGHGHCWISRERVLVQETIAINGSVAPTVMYWFTFHVPLSQSEATGDSWAGFDTVTAQKVQ